MMLAYKCGLTSSSDRTGSVHRGVAQCSVPTNYVEIVTAAPGSGGGGPGLARGPAGEYRVWALHAGSAPCVWERFVGLFSYFTTCGWYFDRPEAAGPAAGGPGSGSAALPHTFTDRAPLITDTPLITDHAGRQRDGRNRARHGAPEQAYYSTYGMVVWWAQHGQPERQQSP